MKNDGLNPIPPADEAGIKVWLGKLYQAVKQLQSRVDELEARLMEGSDGDEQ